MSRKSGRTCAVLGCSNSSGKLQLWNKKECELHKPLLHEECPCLRPYSLHRFPGRAEERDVRQKWVKNINRKDFVPNNNSTVCGIHFLDGKPTKEHPHPVLHMGYEHHSSFKAPAMRRCGVGVQWPDTEDHNYCLNKLTKHSATQTDPAPSVSAYNLDDKGYKFYTGIGIHSFWQLLYALMASLPQPGISQLAVHEQLLLVLMRLRLDLKFTDLSKRFGIGRSTACDIFTLWRPVLAKFMREKVIAWLPRDTLKTIRPRSFSENYPNATCITGCTEIFVRRPKHSKKQSQTHSNYEHHKTYKVLYCIAPNGYVMFVSKLFLGRASDALITEKSGLVDHLIPGDQILAVRGFTITDAFPPGVTLTLSPFTRTCKELCENAVRETHHLAKVRIHVERAIRRLKGFTILSNVIPGRVKHVDDIVSICAGLCNLQTQLTQEETEDEEASDGDEEEDIDEDEVDEYLWDIAEDTEENEMV